MSTTEQEPKWWYPGPNATEPDDGPIGEVPPAVAAYETRLDVTRAEVVRLTGERDDYATRLARVGVANLDLLAEVEGLTARLRAVTDDLRDAFHNGDYGAVVESVRAALSSDAAPQAAGVTRERLALDDLAADVDLIDPMHTVYAATDNEPAECTDECPGCAADRIRAALGIPVADAPAAPEVPFFRDVETGEPCPRRGSLLCTVTDPEHLHRAIHMDAPAAPEGER